MIKGNIWVIYQKLINKVPNQPKNKNKFMKPNLRLTICQNFKYIEKREFF